MEYRENHCLLSKGGNLWMHVGSLQPAEKREIHLWFTNQLGQLQSKPLVMTGRFYKYSSSFLHLQTSAQ